jgi:LEA14-like dessication related protein
VTVPLAVVLLALRAAAAPLAFALHVAGETQLVVTLSGPAADLPAGPFRGAISLNGSPVELPIAGTVAHAEGRWRLPVTVRYAEVPADWADRFRPETFSYRLRGGVSGAPREWTGTRPWRDVEIDGDRETLAGFLELSHVGLTHVSLFSSEATAELALRNPFSFPLKIAETQYTLLADGQEVGEGQTRGLLLHPSQKNVLSLPIEIDHAQLLSAAGKAAAAGGEVAVRLKGHLVIRLKSGDLTVPLNLASSLHAS